MTWSVECPCCHGRGYLVVFGSELTPMKVVFGFELTPVSRERCCHCQGSGNVMSEVAEPRSLPAEHP